ncbi:MAG: type II secretion system F family protein [Propionibacteriaceae bacterium]|jgi:pilus assembly protein TadC|nr:type II secretion system F family protein [Propionibacteriaceae bacterium]
MEQVVAAILAGWSMWLWWPSDPADRLKPARPLTLPRWMEAEPGAMPSRTRWLLGAGVGIAGFLASPFSPILTLPLAGVIVVAVWVVLGKMVSGRTQTARRRQEEALPEALDLIRLCLKAGSPLRSAVATTASGLPAARSALGKVLSGVAVGLSDSEAWASVASDPVWGDVSKDVSRAVGGGLSVERVLVHHAQTARRRVKTAQLTAAKAVGVKSVAPLGACYLPAFLLLGVVPVVASGIAHVFS